MRNILIGLLVGALVAGGLALVLVSANPAPADPDRLGAALGRIESGLWTFVGGLNIGTKTSPTILQVSSSGVLSSSGDVQLNKLIFGSGKTTLTTGATTSVTAANVCDSGIISWVPTGANASFTLPTAQTLVADCIPTVGMSKMVYILNAAATSSFVTATSTGLSVRQASTTGATFVITSSTPTWLTLTTTLASGSDSTVDVNVDKYTISF
ncbi:MAG: hypothetical protein Q8L86_12510 [Vicinamibacterales bacterium]|nr:hypothetical protein [Vicinamibacterales bacterium]